MNTVTKHALSDFVSQVCDFNTHITATQLDEAFEQTMSAEGVEVPESIMTRIGILRAQLENNLDTKEAKKTAIEHARSCMRSGGSKEEQRGRVLFLLQLSARNAARRVRLARAELTAEARDLGATPTFFQ